MANDRQSRWQTRFVVTRDVGEYRETVPHLVGPEDSVLELGCEWGTTTALLAERTPHVIGTDVSSECIERARRRFPELRFEVLDAFDVRAAVELAPRFSRVYMDLSGFSGYRSVLDALALLTMYATILQPEFVVAKSAALKHLGSHLLPWNSDQARRALGLEPR